MATRAHGRTVADGSIGTADIANDAVTADKLANDAVVAANIVDGTITQAKLAAGAWAAPYVEIREQQTAGTDGGTFSSGAWRTRELNTEVHDTDSLAALSLDQITLQAGTYECDIACTAFMVDMNQARLYNVTGAATVLAGTPQDADAAGAVSTVSRIAGRFTIAAAQALEIQHQCATTRATDGRGKAANFGEAEVYTVARFWRVG